MAVGAILFFYFSNCYISGQPLRTNSGHLYEVLASTREASYMVGLDGSPESLRRIRFRFLTMNLDTSRLKESAAELLPLLISATGSTRDSVLLIEGSRPIATRFISATRDVGLNYRLHPDSTWDFLGFGVNTIHPVPMPGSDPPAR